jgi:hypothetical protein
MHNLHTLTALTGKNSSANRTVIIQGFEARRRTVIVLAVGAVPALFITAVLWVIIGQYAVLALPAVEGLVFWLVESRTRGGLQLRTYESLLDKKRSDAGKFYLCGRVIDPELNELGTIVAAAIPAISGGSSQRESRPVRQFDVDRVFGGAR